MKSPEFPLISVIIPVYNAEFTLKRCIESVIKQTYRNLEIILIDDGSNDNSGVICDLFANIDSRVLVIHSVNQGVSEARNKGLNIANGKYVSFLDSDDFLIPSAYEKLIDTAIRTTAQVVWSDFFQLADDGQLFSLKSFAAGNDQHSTISNMISYGPNSGTLWNYLLIDSSLLNDHCLSFPGKYKLGEDFWFGLKVHVYSHRSAKINEPLYCYYLGNPTSLTHSEDSNSTFEKWNCLCESYAFLKDHGIFNEYEKEISWRMLLAKTPWVMSPSTFKYYYSLLPEVNSFVDSNPLLGKKMKYLMRLLNNNHKFFAALLSLAYSIKNRLFS